MSSTLTLADELRAAAGRLRQLAGSLDVALAAWLETEAASSAGDENHADCTPATCVALAALVVARQILAVAPEGAGR